MNRIYLNRHAAGKAVAEHLRDYGGRPDVLVLGLPRGGVPVAYQIAEALDVPMDLLLVRKLGVPGHEELAMGALAFGGVRYLNQEILRRLAIPPSIVERVVAHEQEVLEIQSKSLRGERPAPNIRGKTIIVVDDGLATGATMAAAIIALRQQQPARIVIAAPVAPADTCREMEKLADEVICASTPEPFLSVGSWYEDFRPVEDDLVRGLLRQAYDTVGTR